MGRYNTTGKGKIMDNSIRGSVYSVTDFPKEAQAMTLRDAVEWFKNVGNNIPTPSNAEVKYMNERWAHLCKTLAEREGVGAGYMSYMLNELAVSEMQMVEQAVVEATS